jgi:hypothetical protein
MKLLNTLGAYFLNIWNYRRNKKKEESLDQILTKLENAIAIKQKQQFLLQGDIMHKMKRYLKIGAASQFIPINGRSEFEIRTYIEKKWGKRMKRYDLYLTNDMRLEVR